ncbi:hypothetical protein C9J48_11625 [Photobacterium profundum]|uniref:Uncharacterized protein n=1 Tax=Photobacterium profundum 3TCK TaxID=314280 RepID=Q1YYY6_9GAMM|nr:hypothetical protein [Photobacterium profundum]EAS41555.1 hypothetical protein P3TCK_07931 [Photobacterium profundum 3TCK]PSV62593.1 hypothetical protein C9J48_11625 [Photobacterium profundum]
MRSLFIVIFMCTIVSTVNAETLLMSHDMYIERCLSTFGEDPLTKRVCEKQYQDIEKKELQLMAQIDTSQKESSLEGAPLALPIDNVE